MPKRNSGTSEPVGGTVGADGAVAGTGGSGQHSVADELAAAGFTIIEPAALGDGAGSNSGSGNDTAEQPAKRRGRKPGSRNANGKTQALDINGVEAILFSAHTILATIVKTPEIALDQIEARQMAEAIGNVSRHYDIAATQKTLDWANLIMAAGMIYGTRLYAIRAKRVANKPASPKPNGSTHIPGVGDVILSGEVPLQ